MLTTPYRFIGKSLVLLFSLLIFTRCTEPESGLETKTITDPGAISPVIALSRYINTNNERVDAARVQIYDKNINLLLVENGRITVNDSVLSVGLSGYEWVDSLGFIQPDSVYDVAIMLSDSSVYHCTLQAPKTNLHRIYAPEFHSRSSALPIAWQEVDSVGPQLLEYYYFFTQNNQMSYGVLNYSIWEPEAGVYSLAPDLLSIVPNISSVRVVLHYSIEGTMDAAFGAGGSIGLDMAVEKNITIVN
ncbi:MAG: hypothetical protein K9N34_07310 [Candidatus Marinimicrobia bacterium]|nr:hypothetical protein [Candidatus Neomarinimicrobiota bacterium]MCF7840846.1 hypothetical protein [Candidatus Neomarinimicrobiota bacterium]